MSELDTINAKLDEILSTLKGGGAVNDKPAWMNPPITSAQAVIDGKTVNSDGSIWDWDESGRFGGEPGKKFPVCSSYGYFSKEKAPDVHGLLEKEFGQHYLNWYEERDPWAIYKADISDMARTGVLNWITFALLMQPHGRFVQ